MPLIRLETRPVTITAQTDTFIFGPWPFDVLIRTATCQYSIAATGGLKRFIMSATIYPTQIMFEAYDAPEAGAFAFDGVARSGQVLAAPGLATYPTVSSDGLTAWAPLTGTNLNVTIPIPYNLIIPQRGIVQLRMDGAAGADNLSNAVLVLEYGREASLKKAGVRSSKNNP